MDYSTCVMSGNKLADYHFGESHPFGPDRYWAFKEALENARLDTRVQLCSPAPANARQLALFHTDEYIQWVIKQSAHPDGFLDAGDTPARKNIYEAACVVVGSVLKAIDQIMHSNCQHAFSPIAGLHHATRTSAAGFCVFNDCGIAIEYLRQQYQLNRIAYIDIDAHHGDGVFYAFESEPGICIVDFHQDGRTLYPGSGFMNETGLGSAKGSKLNIPLPPQAGDELALKLWNVAESFIHKAQPEFIILQCGADSLSGDPITQLELSKAFHRTVTKRLCLIADTYCHGRLLALGGGGYNLHNLKRGWISVVESLLQA